MTQMMPRYDSEAFGSSSEVQAVYLLFVRDKYCVFSFICQIDQVAINPHLHCSLLSIFNTFCLSQQFTNWKIMSWTTRAGRFLSFMWKSGTTGVQGLDENTAQSAIESTIDALKGSHPELANAKKAIVRYEL